MLYGQQDADDLYSVFGYKPGELENIINNAISETYYSKIANFNPRAAKNPVTVLSMCIIKYFFIKKDKQNLDLSMIYLSFSGNFYPSIHYAQYPKALPSEYRWVCDYVINNDLSNKFDLKSTGSVIGTIKSISNTWINTYDDRFKGVTDDEDYVYLIQQLHVRIKSFIKTLQKHITDVIIIKTILLMIVMIHLKIIIDLLKMILLKFHCISKSINSYYFS